MTPSPTLKQRTIAAALAALPAAPAPASSRRGAVLLWSLALAFASAPLWAPSSAERDARFDRGATNASRALVAAVLRNLNR